MPKICINPGHAPNGIPDPGAVGCNKTEAVEVLQIGRDVVKYLREAECHTKLIQSDSLAEIAQVSNDSFADVFVSIHLNATIGGTGTETLFNPNSTKGKKLAQCIQDQVAKTLGLANRGLKERTGLYVLNATDAPAALVEICFIDNERDMAMYDKKYPEISKAIARGITDYFVK